jgi:acetyl-CoA acetyltransferase family protein
MDVVFAGGIESMSRVSMGSDGAYSDETNTRGPTSDWLMERFPGLVPQGVSAEMVAEKYGLTRADCDAFAAESQRRAGVAMAEGRFEREIAAMALKDGRVANVDEHARPKTTVETLSALPAVFKENGVVTAGNASGIVDGASCVVVMDEELARARGLKPRARIKTMAVVGSPPEIMLTGPMPATRKALSAAKMSVELNRFAVAQRPESDRRLERLSLRGRSALRTAISPTAPPTLSPASCWRRLRLDSLWRCFPFASKNRIPMRCREKLRQEQSVALQSAES